MDTTPPDPAPAPRHGRALLSWLAAALLTTAAAALALWPRGPTDADYALARQATGFVALVPGRDLSAWRPVVRHGDAAAARRVFQATGDGVIHVFRDHPDGFERDAGTNSHHGMLYSRRTYSRFILRFSYRWGHKRLHNYGEFQHDAGLYYHVFDPQLWPRGLEYQVRVDTRAEGAEASHTGDLYASGVRLTWYAQGGRSRLPRAGGEALPNQPGVYRAAAWAPKGPGGEPEPQPSAALPAAGTATDTPPEGGRWRHCAVVVMGADYAIHLLDGQVVNYAEGFNHDRGLIGLQAETAEVQYRDVAIRELPRALPAAAFLDQVGALPVLPARPGARSER